MKIDMAPHSGVLAWDWRDRPFPVIGWCTYEGEEGGMVVMPLVLDKGVLTFLNDGRVRYSLVGNLSPYWAEVVGYHNGDGQGGNVHPAPPG